MKRLNLRQIRILKIIHILFIVMWIGGGICLITILFIAEAISGYGLYMKFRSMQVIDDYIIIPGAIGCFLIGLMYSIWTNWGFFKQRWITIKWILTIIQILFGTFALGPWLNNNVDLSYRLKSEALHNPDFMSNLGNMQLWGTIQVVFLFFMVIISVIKPWKNKRESITERM